MSQPSFGASSTEIPIAEMIQTLRKELQLAQEQAPDEEIAFEVDKVELELKVAISRAKTGQGGIEFWVIKAGGEMERSHANTHTFKLTLMPVSASTGERIKVSESSSQPAIR